MTRTQEFVLRRSGDDGRTYRDTVRQQYTFSPPETVREVEDYTVRLEGVTIVELHIIPNTFWRDEGVYGAGLTWTARMVDARTGDQARHRERLSAAHQP